MLPRLSERSRMRGVPLLLGNSKMLKQGNRDAVLGWCSIRLIQHQRMLTTFFRFVIYTTGALLQSAQALATPAPGLPVRAGVIIARIETNKSVYQLGEPILLRLTLINTTGQPIFSGVGAPYWMSDLKVSNAGGKPVFPGGGRGRNIGAMGGRIYSIALMPGKPVLVGYNDPDSDGTRVEWADIREWGYDLREPGNYTIRAVAAITAIGTSGPEFKTSGAASNTVHFTIVR
jgi:hypothetical protein